MKIRGVHDGVVWGSVNANSVALHEEERLVRARIGHITNTFAKLLFEDDLIVFNSHLSLSRSKPVGYSVLAKTDCRLFEVGGACAVVFFDLHSPNHDPKVLVEDPFCKLHVFRAGAVNNYALSLKSK